MKLKKYLKKLGKLIEENPEILELQVVTADDDEGNSYTEVCFAPSVGHFEQDDDDFTPLDQFEDFELELDEVNAICLN